MNCQDINQLLDANAPEELTRMQSEKIERHFASCAACREDWVNWREIAALEIPATPVGLRGRVAVALLPQRGAAPRRSFRPFVIGGLVLAGAALAAAAALHLTWRTPDKVSVLAGSSLVATSALASTEVSAKPQSTAEPAASSRSGHAVFKADNVADKLTTDVPLDPHGIVVLKRPEMAADALAIAVLARCHDAIVRQLHGLRGLNVIADAAVSRYEGGSQLKRLDPRAEVQWRMQRADGAIARALGAGNVLVVGTQNGCAATVYNSQTGATVGGLMSGGSDLQDDWDSFANHLAQIVRDKMLQDQATVLADARGTLLDTTLSDRERVAALWKSESLDLQHYGRTLKGFFDRDVLAAAVRLGTRSNDPTVRQDVWAELRQIDDPVLVQPLLEVLANDQDAEVRMQAALALNAHLGQPGVLDALNRAAAEDPSKEPAVTCCVLTVREAARMASIADRDVHDWVRSTLLDESLPARSRLLPLQNASPDVRFLTLTIADFGNDAAKVVFDIGRREQNPQVRSMAWNTLQFAAPDAAFVPVLLADLAGHPEEYVRASAAKALGHDLGDPAVRAAIERALNDPSIEVRRVAAAALAPSGK